MSVIKELRVGLVSQAPFPVGNVSTMRYTSYMKALFQNGIYSYVLIYCPTRMAAHIKTSSGSFNGIEFQYSTLTTWKKYNLWNKGYYLFKGLLNSISYLNSKNLSTLILYGDNSFVVTFFYWLYTRVTKKRFIGDRSELPSVNERKSKLKMSVYALKQRMFDGMIIMTKQLMSFYSQYSRRKDFLFLLPMTIDPLRFEGLKKKIQERPYIAVVFGTHNRDGLVESLRSYELYCKKGGTYELQLIGDYENMPNKVELDALIKSLKFKERIHILGKLPNDSVPRILYNASVLLTTPNFYISGGFPTKLGEYMLSEVPIVATKVGELLDYIEPGIDMLMSEPRDYESISSCMLKLEGDSMLAQTLSRNAKRKAQNVFCVDSYMDSFLKFLALK